MALILAIVETPLQLLCAYEAISLEPAHVVVLRLTSVKSNDAHTLSLAKFLGLRYVVIDAPVGARIDKTLIALWPLRKLIFSRYKAVYLGSYFSGFIRVVSWFFLGQKYFLDDGMATLLSLKEMKKKRENFALFTFFDIDPLPGQLYVRHCFKRIRTKFNIVGKEGHYFIGQPLVEKGIVSLNDYLYCIHKAVDISDGVLDYVPHRNEDKNILKVVVSISGVRINQMASAVEVELLRKGQSPRAVFSCFSTALLTLSILFPETYVVCFIQCLLMDDSKVPHKQEIEHAIRKSGKIAMPERW